MNSPKHPNLGCWRQQKVFDPDPYQKTNRFKRYGNGKRNWKVRSQLKLQLMDGSLTCHKVMVICNKIQWWTVQFVYANVVIGLVNLVMYEGIKIRKILKMKWTVCNKYTSLIKLIHLIR